MESWRRVVVLDGARSPSFRALYDGTLLPRDVAIESWSLSKTFEQRVFG
ncbi:MAG TPA: hypothetical protein VLV78_02245 [Thermoanaerobaculia bacterium]|nr:hypothetical protein [Thermoanaerobaculia bacterium]